MGLVADGGDLKSIREIVDYGLKNYSLDNFLNDWTGDMASPWVSTSMADYVSNSEALAKGLLEHGLKQQSHVAVYMNSDSKFVTVDMACIFADIVTVPLHLNLDDDSIKYILKHAETELCFLNNVEQLKRIAPLAEYKTFILTDTTGADAFNDLDIIALDDLLAKGRELSIELPEVPGDNMFSIIYTSGTTGLPKGVVLNHSNVVELTKSENLALDGGIDNERLINYLPLSHIFAKTCFYVWIYHGTQVFFSNPELLMQHMAMVKPTNFCTVPRVLEKVNDYFAVMGDQLPEEQKGPYQMALQFVKTYDPDNPTPEGEATIKQLDPIFQKWRGAFGGELKYIISGGAALRPGISRMLRTIGIQVLEGYGLTELPVIAVNRFTKTKSGTVGPAIPGVELKIADDGEILVRGPLVMQGYYNNPEDSAETLVDGWLHTGDIGELDDDGYLKITDRKKNIFKMANGKFVIPMPLEASLNSDLMIAQSVVIGSGRPFCTVLIFPELERLPLLAQKVGLQSQDIDEILASPMVQGYFQQAIAKANSTVPDWSTIKQFLVLNSVLAPENGLMTSTLKVKKKKVEETFQAQIDALYESTSKSKSIMGED